MKKKVLVGLLVLALAVAGLSAKDLGIKVGGELGWGIDIARMRIEEDDGYNSKTKAVNNGFAANLTGEYDFNETWGVKASFGMMFAGKTNLKHSDSEGDSWSQKLTENAGLYIDFAVDGKYTYAINDKISVSGLAGFELVSGYLAKGKGLLGTSLGTRSSDEDLSIFKNTAIGVNGAVEGSYKVTDKITVSGGVSAAWFFINTTKLVDYFKDLDDVVKGVASFYIRPYVGATYSF